MVNLPLAMAVAPNDDVYWTDAGTAVIRKLSGGIVTTVAGTPRGPGYADGPAVQAKFGPNGLNGLAFFGFDLFIAGGCLQLFHRICF